MMNIKNILIIHLVKYVYYKNQFTINYWTSNRYLQFIIPTYTQFIMDKRTFINHPDKFCYICGNVTFAN